MSSACVAYGRGRLRDRRTLSADARVAASDESKRPARGEPHGPECGRAGADAPAVWIMPPRGSDHVLERLERAHLDDVARGLGLEGGLLAGEGVDALTRLG